MLRVCALVLLIVTCTTAATDDDPIEVDPYDGTLSPLNLTGTTLTTTYCVSNGFECRASDIDVKQFAPTISQCLARCNRELQCLNAFFDKTKTCYLRNKRCLKEELVPSINGTDLYRLQTGETCPTGRPKWEEPNYNLVNKFCMYSGKSCKGHNLYDNPQSIFPLQECLKKCAKISSCFGVDFRGQKCEPKDYQCKDSELIDEVGAGNFLRLRYGDTVCPKNRVVPTEAPPVPVTPDTCTNPINTAATVRQSSVSWAGNPERAVDGNTDGEYFHNSCSCTDIESEPWWYADFCRQLTIYGVLLTNRNILQSRLSMIDVAVTNADLPQYYPASDVAFRRMPTFFGTIKLKFKQSKKGRYLVIKLRKQDYLTLCEVQWVTSADALTEDFVEDDGLVSVQQSTVGYDGSPERAVDGNTDGEYAHNSCSCTLLDNPPWWYAEFEKDITIYGVKLSNRNIAQSRLSMIEVAVKSNVPPQIYASSDVAVRRWATFDGTLKLKFKLPKTGRYLVVKLRKQDFLTLCEVQWVTNAAAVTKDFIDGDDIVSVHQSSVAYDGSPDRAIDGNTDGEYAHNSCTCTALDSQPWWYVEFSTPVTIFGVMVSNRNIVPERLTPFEVAVTNTDPPQNYGASDVAVRRWNIFTGTLKLKFKSPKSGRYLVIKLRKQDFLTLCEVQWVTSASAVTGDFVDGDMLVAVKQSSVGYDGNPERAVDGNTDGEYGHNSCTCTLVDNPSWWYGDFGTSVTIFGVMVSNRNIVPERLSPFEVAVTNTDPPQNYGASDVAVRRWNTFTGTLKLKFKLPKSGRYLVIKLRKPNYLTLCEVQWVTSAAALTADFIYGDDIVSVHQSTVAYDGSPERAIDGNTDGEYSHNSCTCTALDSQPWWYVEFSTQLTVYGVVLSNRNIAQERLTQFEVALTNSDPPQNYPTADVAVRRIATFFGALKLKFKSPKTGRYLVINMRKQDFLTLCEVQWVTSAAAVTGDFVDGDMLVAVKQSSVGYDGNPERAVDGNTDGEYGHNSCTCTLVDNPSWWYGDFGTSVTIFGVMISNRNIVPERLSPFEVAVTNTDPPQNCGTSDVAVRRWNTFTGTLRLKFKFAKSGRYLIIKLRKPNYLTLCEVQWVTSAAALTADFIYGDDIVSVHQSTVAYDGSPERAIDGNTDGEYSHNSCTCTALDSQPWWYVEFGTQLTIRGVMLSNRNIAQSRLSKVEVAVTNTFPPQTYSRQDVAVYRDGTFDRTLKLKFNNPKTGSYLVVRLRKQEFLTLCEVQWVTNQADLTADFIDGDPIPSS